MPYANLKIGMTEVQKQAIINEINTIYNNMPYLILLTTKEKKQGMQLGNLAPTFLQRSLLLAKNNPNVVPSFIDMSDWGLDVQDHRSLCEIRTQLNKLQDAVNCTIIALEQEAMRVSLSFYKVAKSAETQGVMGASMIVDELSQMMPRTKK